MKKSVKFLAILLILFVGLLTIAGCSLMEELQQPEAEQQEEKTADPQGEEKEESAHSHAYGEWQVTKEPTCTEAGERMRVCSCGERQIEEIKAKGHSFAAEWMVSEDAHWHKCDDCDAVSEKAAHDFEENVCKICAYNKVQYSEGLEFTFNGDGTCSVTDLGTCTDTELIIPKKSPAGDTVTSIGDEAFLGCSGLTSISIPDSVTSIGDDAFCECTGLTSVTIGNSVTSIGDSVFYGCTGLTSVTIGDSVTSIGGDAFVGCYKLIEICNLSSLSITAGSSNKGYVGYYAKHIITDPKDTYLKTTADGYLFYEDETNAYLMGYNGAETKLTLPEKSPSGKNYGIYQYAFSGCTGLTSITIPNSATSIGGSAFYGCTGLTSITISDSVTNIGGYAFCYCTGLTSVTIGDSVTSIGGWAFDGCYKLIEVCNLSSLSITAGSSDNGSVGEYAKHIITDPKDTYLKTTADGYLFCEDETNAYLMGYNGAETKLTLPEKSPSGKNYGIYSYAFSGCTGLTSITIPNSVTSIGDGAFSGCYGLTAVTIPDSVTSIGECAFSGCSGLTSVTIPNSVTSIDWGAFCNCSGLTSVTIPDSVTSIGDCAFYGCSGLTSVTIPDSVTSIGGLVFDGCYKLIEVCNLSSLSITAGSSDNGSVGEYAKHIITDPKDTYLKTTADGYLFYEDEANAYLMGYNGAETELTLPEKSPSGKNYGIYQYAFSGCSGLTSVTIGNSVTSIGDWAFYDCSGLTSVTIPDSVTSIDGYAFFCCTGLTSVTIPDSVTSIGKGAFFDCSGLTSISVAGENTVYCSAGNCLIEIASKTLILGCQNSVIPIDGSVTSIGGSAFSGCTGLISITIPDSVTSIGECAFEYCFGLTSVTIPDSVTSIDGYAFSDCVGLKEVHISDIAKWCNVTFVSNFSNPLCYAHNLYLNDTLITALEIPDSVTSIGGYAFYGCSGLTSITIPDSVTSIGNSAFSGCTGLSSITIPDSVTSIGKYAFNDCPIENAVMPAIACSYVCNPALKTVVITSGTSIGSYAFSGCTGLTSVTIPDSVTSIGDYAFYHCTGLTTVTIGNSVTSIGKDAFYGCSGLTSITIPDSVTSIGSSAFSDCTGLTSVTIPTIAISSIEKSNLKTVVITGGTSIGNYAFYDCSGLTSVTIPDSVTSIGAYAFSGCTNLESVTVDPGNSVYHSAGNCVIKTASKVLIFGCKNSVIPTDGSVTSIGDDAFFDCTGLTSVTIPDSVTSIGNWAFYGCSGLTSVTIPDSVTSIGKCAFEYCTGLTSVTIPDSVTSIGWDAFCGCTGLTSISVAEDNKVYRSVGNCLIETASKTLILGCQNSVIPADGSVTSIGDDAFSYCTGLTSVTIPDSVTSIGDWAFYGCSGLTSVTIPDSVTYIGWDAFSGCTNLESVTVDPGNSVYHSAGNCVIETASKALIFGCKNSVIPTYGSVTSIGDDAFYDCTGLTSVTIPDSVTSIGWDAFSGCTNLESVTVDPGNSVYHSAGNCVIKTASKALIFGCKNSVIPTDGSVTSIGDDAFSYCTGLTSVTIPDSVTSIGDWAFYGCSGLTSITFTGTIDQWNAIRKVYNWNDSTGSYTIHCTDGDIDKS